MLCFRPHHLESNVVVSFSPELDLTLFSLDRITHSIAICLQKKFTVFSRVNFVHRLLFNVHSTPFVTAVAHKRPWSSCQKCRWQVTHKHAYILEPTQLEWADSAAVQAECENLSGNKLTHNSSGSIQPRLSQLTEPPWTDPGLKSGIGACELISTLKKKKAQAGNEWSNILPKSWQVRKKPAHLFTASVLCALHAAFETYRKGNQYLDH